MRFAVKALIATELAYLLVANLVLATPGFQRALDPVRPGTRVRYASAWSLLPGHVAVRDLLILRNGPTRQWSIHADRAWALLDPLTLPFRRADFPKISAQGVEIRVRKRPEEPRNTEREALLPPIEGMSLEDEAPPRRLRRAWRFRVGHLTADEVRELWIDTLRWTGEGRAAGGFTTRPRESTTVYESRVEMRNATLAAGTRELATHLAGNFTGHSREFRKAAPREVFAWLEPFTLRGDATAEGVVGESLDPYLPAKSPLHLVGGSGPIRAHLDLDDGTLAVGTRLDWQPESLGVNFLGYAATGTGELHAAVPEPAAGEDPLAELRVDLDHFQVGREGNHRPHLEGENLVATLAAADRHLDGTLDGGFRAHGSFAGARIPDLRVYDDYLPEKLGLRVTGGTGVMSSRFDLAEDGSGAGQVDLASQDAALDWDGLAIRGRLEMAAVLATDDALGRVFSLDGTTLNLDDVVVSSPEDPARITGWWAHLTLPAGTVHPDADDYLELEARARLRDADPLEAVFGQRHALLARLAKAIDSTGVTSEAQLAVSKSRVTLRSIRVAYPAGSLDATLEIAPGQKAGRLLARWKRWAVGLAFRGKERDWILRRAEEWWAAGAPVQEMGDAEP